MSQQEFLDGVRQARAESITFDEAKRVVEAHGFKVIKPPDPVLMEKGRPTPRPS